VHSGGAAPDLRKSSIPLDADTFKSVVRDGALAPAGMPSFDEFTEQELEGLRMYIRQRCRDDLAGKAADTTRPY
jgi:quinohemoprotein ethanol dehydrogenase